MPYSSALPHLDSYYLKNIEYDNWMVIRDAIVIDCDSIIEAYKDDSINEDAPTHLKNARYVKKDLSDVLDGDMSTYKTPAGILDWVKVFVRNKFYLDEKDTENKFLFLNTKKVWEEIIAKLPAD